MNKETAIKYIKDYYGNKQFDVQKFLTEYIIDCGETDLTKFPEFLQILIITNQIQNAIDYAVEYYINKYNIHLIHQIKDNTKIFITAY